MRDFTTPSPRTIAIIGAGFGGLCMAIRLKQAAIDSFTVFEKGDTVGGTWRDNTYPGAACDIPSHLYSYSFHRYRSTTRRYPDQADILRYLEECADTYGLRPHLRLNTEVTRAEFDETTGRWRVHTSDGAEHAFDIVVSAVGQLGRPRFPDVPGMEHFDGTSFHSSRWDSDHDLTGRDVAVIGTGASAVQFLPHVAQVARRVYVFQRTPHWVLPKPGPEFGAPLRWAFRLLPFWHRAYRATLYLRSEVMLFPALRNGWSAPLFRFFAVRYLHSQVPDPALRAKLLPDYPIGCKRIVLTSDYYATLRRENVELVSDKIVRIAPEGPVTADGRLHAVDTIIYATGFRTTEFLVPIEVVGRGGRRLHDEWREGAAAYMGTALPGFPNLFFVYGPNTNLGHNSVILMIEYAVDYIMRCLRALNAHGPGVFEVRPEAMDAWTRRLDEAASRTVWVAGCTSWFKTENGRVTNNWPLPTRTYRKLTRRLDRAGVRIVPIPREPARPGV
ncbi:MAG: NAD(P)/FAD-dependent oxidoreductase [Actinomadura rubrobrunea]|nr:NAD(P)/FAD-dependent oxidoreductase [Actinomadura rubrobrunea]